MTDPMEDFQAERDKIAEVKADAGVHVRRALFLWAFRWAIGFALIWAVTSWTGRFGRLWTVGIVVALISLVLTLVFRILVMRKAGKTEMKLQELTRLIEEQDREDRP